MTKSFTTQAFAIAFAALSTFATVAGTNALAGHQVRVAAAAQNHAQERVASTEMHLVVLGQRVAQL